MQNWTEVPEEYISWYPSDSVSINLQAMNLTSCEESILYFRLNVLDGPNAVPSAVIGLQITDMSDGVSYAKIVIVFDNFAR